MRLKYSITYLISLVSLITNICHAQQPTDCIDSVIICGNSNLNLDVNGIGTQELAGSNNCGSQETNSVWLQVSLVTDGTLGFTLTPESNDIVEDYDFFVFGPNVPCNNIGQAIRCSTTNPQAANQGNNLTGMNSTETDTSEGPGAQGNSFVQWLDVLAGETYFIVIDRPIGNSPFSLEWTGTAEFSEPPANSIGIGQALNIENCDVTAPFNDGFTEFDFTQNTASIIGSQTNTIVTYHATESDANIGINELVNPYTNTSISETIHFRITNTITGCFELDRFQISVNLGPNIIEPTDFELCDNSNDGDLTNGQVIFDLSSKNNEILNGQNSADFNISYHLTIADAENNTNPFPNLYYNIVPHSQQIFVRIEDVLNPDCKSITTLNLMVNTIPLFNNSSLFQCDEDGIPDGFTLFNLTEANDNISGGFANTSIKYYETYVNAENSVNEINGNSFNNSINPQIVYAQVIDDRTGCFDIAELTLEVSATDANDAVLSACDDDGIEDGFFTFNLLDAEADVLNGLPNNLEVSYYETYENALLEVSPLSTSYTNTIPYSQIVFVRVENMNACYGINEILLNVQSLPDIETQYETLYCLNLFPETINITGGVVNDLPDNYGYSWSTGETSSEIQVNRPGNYSVTVTNIDGCSKLRTVTVLPSNIATIEEIMVTDATNNNTITVIVSTQSEGDYEYALDDVNGPYFDSNIFENVSAGIHIVFVRDKNNCGVIEQLVSVIGFPKFFTPNNDGYNDTWQVKGVNEQFQPNTLIYIFDRYGKLITQVNPLSDGWDGNLNGYPLPPNDYWFTITLQDGRVYKDHFTLTR